MTDFVIDLVLKADEFSETQKGYMSDAPDRPLIRRVLSGLPWWARPVAHRLARREVRALAACAGIAGVPQLIAADRTAILRTYSDGLPLHLARPKDPAFYRDAFRLLRDLRQAGVTHNDLDKPQNWLMSPDGRAKIVDFQLASVHRRRRWLFRQMAYEDFRHLLKHKRRFAPALLTPRGRRIVDSRSAPSRLWRGTGKKLYVAVTRGIFGWSDGEGLGGRSERDGQATAAALRAQPGVRAVVVVAFARSGKAAGLHAFCEADPGTDPAGLAEAHRAKGGSADVIEIVPALPRAANGAVRHDVLSLVAQGQTGALAQLTAEDPALAALAHRPAGRPVDAPPSARGRR
jgi:hypothetical protein